MERCGYDVSREYYVNDTGGQIRGSANRAGQQAGVPLPERGYPSGFVKGLASAYDGEDDIVEAGRWAAQHILGFIRTQMAAVHITFDTWFSQASIEDSEVVAETIAGLQEQGLVWEEEGALWLDTKRFGDPREKRVMRKSPDQGGDYTYLAGDIAYHRNKFIERGFDRVINVWGADHQGQVSSLLAGVEALGVERGRLEIRIGQMVSLAGGRIGKRLGNAVDLDDLVDDIGPDVMRLLSLVASIDQSPTIDLDKVRSESRESPVYYVQYAHARIHSIGKKADELGVTRAAITGHRPRAAHPRARAGAAAHPGDPARGGRAGLRGTGAAQGHRLGPGAGRPVPRLLSRLPACWERTSTPGSPRPGCGWSKRRGSASPSGPTCSA
jgi:arginyl-tRNA synthetase